MPVKIPKSCSGQFCLYCESSQLQHILPLPPWETIPNINHFPCALMPGNLCHPCCGLGAVMMLQSQLCPACQASWAAGAVPQPAQLSTEGAAHPQGTPALTAPPFKVGQPSPCNTWGFSLKPRTEWSQNWGPSTRSWSATKSSARSLVWARCGQPVLCPAKAWAGRSLVLAGCLDAAIWFGKWRIWLYRHKLNRARRAPGQRAGVYLLAQT